MNEPSEFEPLKVYCICCHKINPFTPLIKCILFHLVNKKNMGSHFIMNQSLSVFVSELTIESHLRRQSLFAKVSFCTVMGRICSSFSYSQLI